MTRTKKIIAGIIVALLVLLLAGFMSIDAIAASILRSEGTAILGVKADVSSIRVGIFSSDTRVRGLTVANPEGFERPDFVKLESADIEASVGSMLSSDIQIPTVTLDGLTLDLEQIDDRLNATVIVDHVTKATASDDTDASEPVQLNIGTLEIRNIHLTASGSIVNLAGGKLDAEIPSFVMKNVGTKTDDGDLSGQVVSLALGILLNHLKENPIQGLSGAAVGSLATAIEAVPGLREIGVGKALLDVNRSLNEGLDAATDGVKHIGSDIGGLLVGGSSEDGEKDDKDDEGKTP